MNREEPVSGQPPAPDQRIDRELKDEELHPANQAQKAIESRAGRTRIEPNQQAIIALQRVSGAHVHRANGLIQEYTSACYLGEVEMAEATQREMTALAVRCILESQARDAA